MKSLRVLLAEDDAMIAVLLAEIITDLGHRICSIETTEAGVVLGAILHRPDMLIIDAHLGAGSGVVAVQAVLNTWNVPYVLMSGGPIGGAPPGAVMLEKPFFEFDLVAALERALAIASSAPALSAPVVPSLVEDDLKRLAGHYQKGPDSPSLVVTEAVL